jgi:hypothetical protein
MAKSRAIRFFLQAFNNKKMTYCKTRKKLFVHTAAARCTAKETVFTILDQCSPHTLLSHTKKTTVALVVLESKKRSKEVITTIPGF